MLGLQHMPLEKADSLWGPYTGGSALKHSREEAA